MRRNNDDRNRHTPAAAQFGKQVQPRSGAEVDVQDREVEAIGGQRTTGFFNRASRHDAGDRIERSRHEVEDVGIIVDVQYSRSSAGFAPDGATKDLGEAIDVHGLFDARQYVQRRGVKVDLPAAAAG